MPKTGPFPKLGCGVGLRTKHYEMICSQWPKSVDWFEAITENYMDSGGKPLALLEKVREHYPVALHGVALSIGSVDPLNEKYLHRLKALANRIQPAIVSDHLCWSGAGGHQLYDLLPLPFTPEAIRHVVERVCQVQDFLNRPILLENVSTYVTYKHSVMPEWEFLSEVSRLSGCGILLDINNIYVNSVNHGFDPMTYLENIPGSRVGQFHMAGHTDMGDYLFDTHSRPVIEPVWQLYREALKRWGQISTLLEWDEDIPEWAGLEQECQKVKTIYVQFENHPGGIPDEDEDYVSPYYTNESSGKSLKEIQEWMSAFIEPVRKNPVGESLLNAQGKTEGRERLSVYADGYLGRLHEAMSDTYVTVRHLLGEDSFIDMVENYAKRFPSEDYNLNHAGSRLPELIEEFPIRAMPYLKDLARLEAVIAAAFHAYDDIPFDREGLAKIPLEDWEYARLTFQASVSLFISDWPVMDLWKERETVDHDVCVKKTRQRVLIGRKGLQVRCESLNEIQYRLLEGLLCGRLLGEVCEDLAAMQGDESLPVAEWFSQWVHDGLIAQCEIVKKQTSVTPTLGSSSPGLG